MENNTQEGMAVYEVGFHIVPTVAEENLMAEVAALRTGFESLGGIFISEDFPKSRPLAYTISKKVGGTRAKYDRAYFGWIKFEMTSEKLPEFKKALDLNNNILRYLLVHTTRETPVTYSKMTDLKRPVKSADEKPVSVEELDKSIDQLVTE
jgi:ribosomal protein S6